MKTMPHWERTIRARWARYAARAVFAPLAAGLFGGTICGAAPTGNLALLKSGITAQLESRPADAVRDLKAVRARLPLLADYIAYSLAAADFDLGNFDAALADLEPVWKNTPPSPLTGQAALVAARAYLASARPAEGSAILRQNFNGLPQPAGSALLAACYRASGDMVSAAVYYQQVYYDYPVSPEAGDAATALEELKTALGELYPPPMSQAIFERASGLARAGDYGRARTEYEAALPDFAGPDRDLVRVRLGELDYLAYRTAQAYDYLRSLDVSSPEADAERLYYMAQCARRLEHDEQMMDAIKRLERYPNSPWRLKALVSAANRYLLDNRADAYLPLYTACSQGFDGPSADYCHWKVAWSEYIGRRDNAAAMLREHVSRFPASDRTGAALYFLGRLAEGSNDAGAAKAYYAEVAARYPFSYYWGLAAGRLAQPALRRAAESAAARAFLNGVSWPERTQPRTFAPSRATRARIERARLLDAADLEDQAEGELRFGARSEDQPHVLAVRMAQALSKYSPPHRALQLMKSLVPDYLSIPVEDAPASFWRLLYPLPWRATLERNARLRRLDPYLVAGLVRQESEFNPGAISPARAYGLTQILPSTGRMLLKVSRRRFRPAVLFRPEVNLRLGTTYLRTMYDANSASWEQTLAAYNAGNSRVRSWLTWADYREPAEFVETIPFSETRTYIFAVMRNAAVYRELYGHGPLKAKPAPARKSRPTARKPRPAVRRRTHRK
jgi:soluble lytic murein transglycosylase